jgi:hypothetical protein
MLLVTAEPCALEILRGAYARSVLKPPATYTISSVGKLFKELQIIEMKINSGKKIINWILMDVIFVSNELEFFSNGFLLFYFNGFCCWGIYCV